jgi:CDGSH-type Zn-finger protein
MCREKEIPICNCGDSTHNKPMCDTCLMVHDMEIKEQERQKVKTAIE